MEGRSSLKRSFFEDDRSNKPPPQKRVRFPKGKKLKAEQEVVERVDDDEGLDGVMKPDVAAKERSKRRNQLTAEIFDDDSKGNPNDISVSEVTYEDDENFDEDGIQIEPFNLNKEREEGYFDKEGNYVEYVMEKEIKDAWLDNVDINPKYTGKTNVTSDDDYVNELSSEEIGKMKRQIADLLEPGETVLQALRRLKGTGGRKVKMSAETKLVFDQLTEDAMKLMENGEYNVYNENKEVFEREAEGYEKLARARSEGTSLSSGEGTSIYNRNTGLFHESMGSIGTSASIPTPTEGTVEPGIVSAEVSRSGADEYDMFADEDEPADANQSHDASNISASHNPDSVSQPSSDTFNQDSGGGAVQDDYVYDESSGYYYSHRLGYYYDPTTGLYCSAASGQWYAFNEETGAYEEVHGAPSNANGGDCREIQGHI